MTARARQMGCRVRVTSPTAPAFRFDAVHDGRVKLVLAIGSKIRATSGIEQRIVFENANRRFYCVERRAATIQNLRAGLRGLRRARRDTLPRLQGSCWRAQ